MIPFSIKLFIHIVMEIDHGDVVLCILHVPAEH